MYKELCRTDRFLINYMEDARLYEEDFRTLNKYKLFREMIDVHNIKDLRTLKGLTNLWGLQEDTIEKIIYTDICDIVNELRKNVVMKYLENKED